MTKVAVVKIEHEDALYRIPATDVKEQYGKHQIFEGDKKVVSSDWTRSNTGR